MAQLEKTKFVKTDKIFDEELFLNLEINENLILQTFNDAETVCTFLLRCSLLKKRFCCNVCNSERPMRLVKRAVLVYGYIWNCVKPRTVSKLIRSGFIFLKASLAFVNNQDDI
jgi:hypothetical protein